MQNQKQKNYKPYFILIIGISSGVVGVFLYKKLFPITQPLQIPTQTKTFSISFLKQTLDNLNLTKSTKIFVFSLIATFYFINGRLKREREIQNLLNEIKNLIGEVKKILVDEIVYEKKHKAPYNWRYCIVEQYRQKYGHPGKYGCLNWYHSATFNR